MNNDRFRKDADLLLGGLQWTQADANAVFSAVRGEQPKMKRKLSLGLVLAIVIVLLAAVALAVGLSYSPQYTTMQAARNAVMQKYGLDSRMLRLYIEHAEQSDGTTTVRFAGSDTEFLRAEQMGDYTATVDAKGNATAAWTHDDVDPSTWQGGDLLSDIWGPAQLQMVIDRYEYYQQWQQETPYLSVLPIAEQVKRVAELDKNIAPFEAPVYRTGLPNETDLTEEDALALATKALGDNYGVTLTDEWDVERCFRAGTDSRCFLFSFQKGRDVDTRDWECYSFTVKSPSGEVITANDVLARDIEKTLQMNPSLGEERTSDGLLSQEFAIASAKQSVQLGYGLTDEALSLFTPFASLNEQDGKQIWTVIYLPTDTAALRMSDPSGLWDWRWSEQLTSKLGYYLAQIDATSSEAFLPVWSLERVAYTADYTESNWADAPTYDARILEWVVAMMKNNAPIIAKYLDDQTDWFSVEDAAAYDQAFRDAGFDASRYNHALPKEDDLTADRAKQIACQLMNDEFGLTQKDLEDSHILCEYMLDNGGEWYVNFYTGVGMGGVRMNAATGEIQEAHLDAGESGNG